MVKPIDELRNQLKTLLDSSEDKPTIERIGTMNSLIDNIESEHNQIKEEQKELLKDYKELVKHQSFAPNGKETETVPEQKDISFEDFLKCKPQNN